MRRTLILLLTLLTAAGCGIAEQVAPTTTTTTTTTTTAAPTIPTTADAPAADESPCLAGDRPFAREGIISAFGGANGDAAQLSRLRWASHPGCERVVIELLTADGAPAGAIDPVGVDYNSQAGIIRVALPEAITRSAIADSRFDGELVSGAFVVETRAGSLAVDLHVTPESALALRAFEVDSPSRIVIDVRPDDEGTAVVGASIGTSVVLLSPSSQSTERRVEISGYARGGSGDIDIAVYRTGEDPELVFEATVPAASGRLWQEFATTAPGLPAGVLEVEVAAQRDRSGTPARVTIDTSDRSVPAPPDV
ncbi:MAG: hypothetical protein QNJ75_07450 [Acidimicrobiia bacterium]|nr:hypothetical protein [Acidimicrobiia bacterium]